MVNLSSEDIAPNFKDIQSDLATGEELFFTQPSDVRTGTGITSRRVTKTNRMIAATGREVTLMHTFGVTTTRRWSGPGIKGLRIDTDGHAVFGFDFVDAIPTSDDLFGWVNNLDTLIKNHDIRFEKTQVGAENTGATKCASDENFRNSSEKDGLCSKASEKGDRNPAHNDCTNWAKLRGIVHAPSLPQLNVNVDSKQAEAHV